MINYDEIEEFKGIDLQDSFVLGWKVEDGDIVFQLEFSLWEDHPEYEKPKPGEYTCYKKGSLIFKSVTNLVGLKLLEDIRPSIDLDGSKDYGEIESLFFEKSGLVHISGEFGVVTFYCQGFEVRINEIK